MASDVEIVNNALSLIGHDPITALADDTVHARLANRILPQTRDAVLRAHPWNCAMVRQSLAQISPVPDFGWEYHYTLPTDPFCLRALAINDDEEDGIPGDVFKVEGRTLLTNVAEVNLRYIKRITDPNEYDSLLYEAISAKLAAKMAYAITGSASKAAEMFELYERLLREARTVDGQEGSPDKQDVSILTDIR